MTCGAGGGFHVVLNRSGNWFRDAWFFFGLPIVWISNLSGVHLRDLKGGRKIFSYLAHYPHPNPIPFRGKGRVV